LTDTSLTLLMDQLFSGGTAPGTPRCRLVRA